MSHSSLDLFLLLTLTDTLTLIQNECETDSCDPKQLKRRQLIDLFAAVSDSPYPKEAFSIGGEQDGENTVEGPEKLDMDECQIYEGNICQQICVNTQGSYRCECLPGYVLQDDAFTCAPGNETDHQR